MDSGFLSGIETYQAWEEWAEKWKNDVIGITITDPVTGSKLVKTPEAFRSLSVYDEKSFHYLYVYCSSFWLNLDI